MRLREHNKFSPKSWNGKFQEHIVFILGNGPSLNKYDSKIFANYYTIGVNRCYKYFIPTITIWQDKTFNTTCEEDLQDLPSVLFTTCDLNTCNKYSSYKHIKGDYKKTNSPDILYGSGCTLPLAVQLADVCGFKKIILVGCDGRYVGTETNFYGKNQYHNSNTLKNYNAAYLWIKEHFADKIYDCSGNTYFTQIDLLEFINSIDAVKITRFEQLKSLL